MKTVSVIGMGYIGLPTAMMFASQGIPVIGTDCDAKKIHSLQDGILPIDEDGIGELYQEAVAHGISFSEEYRGADVFIIAVPTPYIKETKKIDASMVLSAFRSVLEICPENAILVLESTVSPGTIDRFVRPLIAEYPEKRCASRTRRSGSFPATWSMSFGTMPEPSARMIRKPETLSGNCIRTSVTMRSR